MYQETGASQAINKTIRMVREVANLKVEFPSYATPSERREIVVSMLEREVSDLRDVAANQENVIGWGSQVILKRAKKQPVWVEWVSGGLDVDDDGWVTTTPEFERTVDEVAQRLRNGRRVVWGPTGWSDDYIRWVILTLDKACRKQNPSFRGTKWNAQPPASWEVFYVLGMDDLEDPHTMGRVVKARKAGKRIIDITGSAPVDLTNACLWVEKKMVRGKLRWAED